MHFLSAQNRICGGSCGTGLAPLKMVFFVFVTENSNSDYPSLNGTTLMFTSTFQTELKTICDVVNVIQNISSQRNSRLL